MVKAPPTSELSRIVARKRDEVAARKRRLPPEVLASLLGGAPPVRDFAAAAGSGPGPRIIAEVKRASPSRGVLRPGPTAQWDPVALARAYARAGARCLSVLTDVPDFWGSDDTLVACREAVDLPVLRKDFVVDPYQVDEARWLGADCVLLMASVLAGPALRACAERARALGMACLLECHSEAQLEAVLSVGGGADLGWALVGINHRDLETLDMDMERSAALLPRVPPGRVVVAESGITTAADVRRLRALGIDTFLVGGSLAGSDDPEVALRALQDGAR